MTNEEKVQTCELVDLFLKLSSKERHNLLENLKSKNDLKQNLNSESSKVDIKKEIYQILKDLGMPMHITGYVFTRKAVEMIMNDKSYSVNITKRLYPELAKEYNSTSSRVERAIRHAVESTFYKGNMEKLHEVFAHTISIDNGKCTNSQFITGLSEYLLMQ